ncbi:MAG: Homoserine kinase [Alphaproteobacteria bacterium ADurb.Bin438]|nr:MAG: Homoserine kinase [Alphaproteobacteria bacterium ADurb.Bin438]
MAVYTKIDTVEMKDFISKYDIGKLTYFKGIKEGISNTNYLVETEQDKFILTVFESRTVPEQIPFFMDLLTHLYDYGINCPTPIKDKKANIIQSVQGKSACLSKFLYGKSVMSPNFVNCKGLGRAMAKLHEAGKNFEQTRENMMGMNHLRPLYDKFKANLDDIRPRLHDEIEECLEIVETKWPKQDELPYGIIHADLFPDNVFFLDNKLSGLIDFFFSCNDFFAYDLAVCINAWCFEKDFDFNVTKVKNLVAGYNSIRPLTKEELHYLPMFCMGSALRFFMTRCFDMLNHNSEDFVIPKDPIEYLRKIRFHKNIKSYVEYGI